MPGKSRTYFELIEAFREPDCAVCRMVNAALLHYIDIFIYENITNEARRKEIRAARGFCSVHATIVAAGHGRAQSIATLEQDVITDVLRQLDKIHQAPPVTPRHKPALPGKLRFAIHNVKDALLPRQNCPLCDYERGQEVAILQTLADDILDPDMQTAFEHSGGLCLPHFLMILDAKGLTSERLARLFDVEYDVLRQVKDDLDEYVRKQNAAYKDEAAGAEVGAPTQATHLTSGRIVHKDGRT